MTTQTVKQVLTILFSSAITLNCLLAQKDSIQTIFQRSINSQYFFIEPEFKTHFHSNRFSESVSMLIGGKTGWIYNSHFVLSFCGYGKITPSTYYGPYHFKDKTNGQDVHLENQKMGVGYGYGGVAIGIILNPYKAVHVNFGSLFGGGSSNEYIIQDNGSHGTTFGSPGFFIIEPMLNLELNLTKKMRFGAGTGYRHIFASHFKSLSSADLSGMSFNIGLKLGSF